MKKPKSITWGSAGYLKEVFDDITTAVKCTRSSQEYNLVDRYVAGIRTDRNNAYTYEVFRTKGKADGRPVKYIVGRIVLGLNGPGRQTDYLAAMRKLLKDGRFTVIDTRIDAIDDLWDFIIAANAE